MGAKLFHFGNVIIIPPLDEIEFDVLNDTVNVESIPAIFTDVANEHVAIQ